MISEVKLNCVFLIIKTKLLYKELKNKESLFFEIVSGINKLILAIFKAIFPNAILQYQLNVEEMWCLGRCGNGLCLEI